MVDLSAISSGLTALNAIKDITQTIIGLRDSAAFETKRAELTTKLIEAHSSVLETYEARTAAIKRVEELEKEIAELKDWETEKQRYELKPLSEQRAVFAYALKPDAQPPEPAHWICPTCYQRGKKRILHPETRSPGRAEVYVCHECGSDLYATGHPYPEHKAISRRPSR